MFDFSSFEKTFNFRYFNVWKLETSQFGYFPVQNIFKFSQVKKSAQKSNLLKIYQRSKSKIENLQKKIAKTIEKKQVKILKKNPGKNFAKKM